ncbi:MAG TPA: biotin--[acetyl-CoA-carboxylase] ligase, partial [Steroidobacteraceae bacterium]|nr:biotin--[acetyl-CoA-carboxylase] ligase [Steroidobacteraceae bacterium]
MQLAMQVLQQLAARRAAETGARQFVSGADLAQHFGVTRSAIWKAISQLRHLETDIEAVTHRGYRLALPATALDADSVRASLRAETRDSLRQGDCAGGVDSTNSQLLARGAPPPGRFDFLTAEFQSAGRGRRGRSWLAPPAGAVCLSWSWCFEGLPSAMGALSLAIGVASRRALQRLGIDGVQLKWPNDLVTSTGKLGGILIEMRTESAGPVHVVIGIGLNVALGSNMRARLREGGAEAADLASLAAPAPAPSRNALVAALLDEGVSAVRGFARGGFTPFRDEFHAADALRDRPVTLQGSGAV